jgi:hypothetical protein
MTVIAGHLIHGAATTIEVGGSDVGSSSESGVTLKATPEWFERMVDQSKTAVAMTLMGRKITVDLELTDCKLSNLLMGLNLASSRSCSSGSCLVLDDSAGAAGTLKIVGPGIGVLSRTWLFENAMVTNEVSYKLSKKDPTVIPLTFNCMMNSATNRIGSVGEAA